MKKQIRLEAKEGRLLSREPFLVAENETLTLEITSIQSPVLLVLLKNGEEKARLTCSDTVEVPKRLLKEGMLEIEVALYRDGVLHRSWQVEPIRIIKHEASFLFNPVLEEFITRLEKLNELEAKYNALQERVTAMESELNEVAELVYDPLN